MTTESHLRVRVYEIGGKVVDRDLQKLAKSADKTEKGFGKVGASSKKASKNLKETGSNVDRLKTSLFGLKSMLAAVAAGFAIQKIIAFGKAVVQSFAAYERAATNVQNITEMTSESMGRLSQSVQALPSSLGASKELMEGLYQALSAGIPKDNAIEFLRINAMAAKGNLADLSVTVKASSAILNAYNLEASETENVLNAMTKTVDVGVLTFSDLANNIGKGIAIARTAGVSYQELMATIASLTLSGLSVEESMTGIRNILNLTINPTTQVEKAMKGLGVEMSTAQIKARGFGGYMADIAKAVEHNQDATALLFPNIRAMGAAMAIATEEGGAQLAEKLDDISDATNKVRGNFGRMSKALSNQMEEAATNVNKLKITIGEGGGEGLVGAFEAINWVLERLILGVKLAFLQIDKYLLSVNKMALSVAKVLNKLFAMLEKFDPTRGMSRSLEASTKRIADMEKEIKKLRGNIQDGALAVAEFAFSISGLNTSLDKTVEVVDDLGGGGGGGGGKIDEMSKKFASFEKQVKKLSIAIRDMREFLENALPLLTKGEQFFGEIQTAGSGFAAMAWAMAQAAEEASRLGNEFDYINDALDEEALRFGKAELAANKWLKTLEVDFAGMFGKGFMGDDLSQIWEEMWGDLAKSMVAILGDAFNAWIKGDLKDASGEKMGLFAGFEEAIKANKLASLIGGAGMIQGGMQQGGLGGVLQGAMGGLMIGAIAGPIGMAVGAIVGGLMAAFAGGQETPESKFTFADGMFGLDTRGHQGVGAEKRDIWERNMRAAEQKIREGYRSVLGLFMDPDLFDLVGAIGSLPNAGKWIQMTAGDMAKWLTDVALPSIYESAYKSAIATGLKGKGVSEATIASLWRELDLLPGAERMQALESFIRAIVNTSQLMEDMKFETILSDARLGAMEGFGRVVTGVLDSIELLNAQQGSMSMIEFANAVLESEKMILQVRQEEIRLLQQIDSIQKSISQSIAQQREALAIGDMTDIEKQRYAESKIEELFDQLNAATDPARIAEITQNIQSYIQMLQDSVGGFLYETLPGPVGTDLASGYTYAEYIDNLLALLDETATSKLGEFRDIIEERNTAIQDALTGLWESLSNFTNAIDTVTGGDGSGSGKGPLDELVNVVNNSVSAMGTYVEATYEVSDALSAAAHQIANLSVGSASVTSQGGIVPVGVNTQAIPIVNVQVEGSAGPLISTIQSVVWSSLNQNDEVPG